jgi:hypothetical protein
MIKYLIILFLLSNVSFGENSIAINVDLNAPTNQEYVDLPVISTQSQRIKSHIGYGIYLEDWTIRNYVSRVHFNNNGVSIKKNTIIVLSGKYEIEKTSNGMIAHKFFVKEPKEIEYIACGVYVDQYRSLLGVKDQLISRTFPEKLK